MNKLIPVIITLLLLESSVFAKNVYIDPSADHNGDGTQGIHASCEGCAGAYNSWDSVYFSSSDDYYQKCGTTAILPKPKTISGITGSEDNPMTIGAYYIDGSEVTGFSGKKPVIRRPAETGAIFNVESSDHIEFRDIRFEQGGYSVWVDASDNFYIHDCEIGAGAAGYGIRCHSGSMNGIIADNIIDSEMLTYGQTTNCDPLCDGIQLHSVINWTIYGNTIRDWGHSGITVHNTDSSEIYDNIVTAENSYYCRGFGIDGGSEYNKFHDNVIQDCNVQNQLGGCSYNEIYNNIIDTVIHPTRSARGISLSGYDDDVHFNTIRNNLIYNTMDQGIYAWSGNAGTVESNTISSNIIFQTGLENLPEYGHSLFIYGPDAGVMNNSFIGNILYTIGHEELVWYAGTKYSCDEFNFLGGNLITDNVCDDPVLEDPGNHDFSFDPASPYKNSGIGPYSDECIPSWFCTSWNCSACSGDSWDCTRICTDTNSCGSDDGKPTDTDTQSCTDSYEILAYWNLEEGPGSTIVRDSTGNGNLGTISGASWTNDSKVGSYALDFDGTNDYIVIQPSFMDNVFSFGGTITAWINMKSFGSDNASYIMSRYDGGNGPWIFWVMDSFSNRSIALTRDFDGKYGFWESNDSLSLDDWIHVAVSYDDSSYLNDPSFYVNGIPVQITSSQRPVGIAVPDSTAPIVIGGRLTDEKRFFSGIMDDIRVYNYILNPDEIRPLANPQRADSDQDGCITQQELLFFIGAWYFDSSVATMAEFMEAISVWKSGTGC